MSTETFPATDSPECHLEVIATLVGTEKGTFDITRRLKRKYTRVAVNMEVLTLQTDNLMSVAT